MVLITDCTETRTSIHALNIIVHKFETIFPEIDSAGLFYSLGKGMTRPSRMHGSG